MKYVFIAPVDGSQAAKLSATASLNNKSHLEWQHNFKFDGNAALIDINMSTARVVDSGNQLQKQLLQSFQQVQQTVSHLPEVPAETTKSPTQRDSKESRCAWGWASSIDPPVATIDQTVLEFQQTVQPICPAKSLSRLQITDDRQDIQDVDRCALLSSILIHLQPQVHELLQHFMNKEVILGITLVCLVEGVLIILLMSTARQRIQPAAELSPILNHANQGCNVKDCDEHNSCTKRFLRDACCSPMIPTALFSSAAKTLMSPAIGRRQSDLSAVAEDTVEDNASVGWAR